MRPDDLELLAPAGDFKTALCAFDAGADAIYLGLGDFSARAFARNFSLSELGEIIRVARKKDKKVYVAFNTLVDEDDLESAIDELSRISLLKPDALIVQDLGIAKICREHFPELTLHASTQLVAHNLEGVLSLKELGFKRVVLARELSIEEIGSIAKRSGVEIEVFIHGALCYSISGLCLYGAMEKLRSGNRGKCPYCCRMRFSESQDKTLPFSMKDLRLDEQIKALENANVCSLKIEGRMKSELYVASTVKYYRQIIDEEKSSGHKVTRADLETVFSRRTTTLYAEGENTEVIDSDSLGHLGTFIGTIKRITKDREGRSYLRFHTSRALEKHDGLQFEAFPGEKPLGMGISEMRQAISRQNVFEVSAGTDVEILLPSEDEEERELPLAKALKPGMKIYCSSSQSVRRMFPLPAYRRSDYPGVLPLDVKVKITSSCIEAEASVRDEYKVSSCINHDFEKAKNPEKTCDGVKKAFSKLGESDYHLNRIELLDEDKLFVPMSILNDLRRDVIEALDAKRENAYYEKSQRVKSSLCSLDVRGEHKALKTLKIKNGGIVPAGDWDEVIVSMLLTDEDVVLPESIDKAIVRLALGVFTREFDFSRLRIKVKRWKSLGFLKWEASDLATLRMLKALGITDITADWTLYAFNSEALSALSDLGVRRFVASPENGRENLQALRESGYDMEFLSQQSTPLFISLTRPESESQGEKIEFFEDNGASLVVSKRGKLWITTRKVPRTFFVPQGASSRVDLSWDLD